MMLFGDAEKGKPGPALTGRASLFLFLVFLSLFVPQLDVRAQTAAPPQPVRVVLYADGETAAFESAPAAPSALLEAAGIALRPGDVLLHAGLLVDPADPVHADPLVLQVQRANTIRLDGESIASTARTVGAALWELGVSLRISDVVNPGPEAPLAADTDVTLLRARPVSILSGEQMVTVRTAAQTVGEALQAAGLALQGLDTTRPAPEMPVPEDGPIRIVRVEEEILIEQTSLPFETLLQPAPELEIDSQQVLQVGQYGLQVSRVRIRTEDGVEVSRETEAAWVAVEPVNRILGYGTQIVVRTLDTPDGTIEYWRAVQAFATSYSPCRLGTDACGNTTASGLPLEKGMVGVIRAWYNAMVFSQVYVPGYGVGVIADIGAGVSGQHWIDLGYSDDDWESWAGTVTIYFLTPVPPADQILWILP